MDPDARLTVGDARLRIVGTIVGFVPDGQRVADAFADAAPEAVALGVPPEDIATLDALADGATIDIQAPADIPKAAETALHAPDFHNMLGQGAAGLIDTDEEAAATIDDTQYRLLQLVARFGKTQIPSPDLELAHRMAREAQVPVVGIDMDDETHTSLYVKTVDFLTVMRAGRNTRKVLEREFEAEDAYSLVRQWDEALNRLPKLRAVEVAREKHMAAEIAKLAQRHERLLAVVPVERFDGTVARLQQA